MWRQLDLLGWVLHISGKYKEAGFISFDLIILSLSNSEIILLWFGHDVCIWLCGLLEGDFCTQTCNRVSEHYSPVIYKVFQIGVMFLVYYQSTRPKPLV